MNALERAVVDAARAYSTAIGVAKDYNRLIDAVQALDAAESAAAVTNEVDITWGLVVETDKVLVKDKWYTVISVAARRNAGDVVLIAKAPSGVQGKMTRPAGDPVRVQRSEMGQAVDVLASVVWSR